MEYLLENGRIDTDAVRRTKNIPCCLFPFLAVLEAHYDTGSPCRIKQVSDADQPEILEKITEISRIRDSRNAGLMQLVETVVLETQKIWDSENWLHTVNILLYELQERMEYQQI